MKDFSIKAMWQIPGEKKISPGELEFNSKKGITLKLMDSFETSLIPVNISIPIIHGTSSDGELYTVVGSYYIDAYSYRGRYIFKGIHLEDVKNKLFTGLRIESPLLNNWVGITGFDKADRDYSLNETNIHYKQPDDIPFQIGSIGKGYFAFSHDHLTNNTRYNVSCTQSISLNLSFSEPHDFERSLEIFNSLFQFLTFLCQNTPPLRNLYLNTVPRNEQEAFLKINAEVFFRSERILLDIADMSDLHENILSHLKDIKDFSSIISKWFELDDQIKPALNILFETFLQDYFFSENAFLNISQAIELLHRRLYPGKEIGERNGKKKYTRTILRDRLRQLFAEIKDIVIVKKINPDESFIDLIVFNRNYYTHYNASSAEQALKPHELWKLTTKLKVLLIVIILKKIGFDDTLLNSNTATIILNKYIAFS